MVGNHKERFLAQAQAFGFHRSGHHLKGFARAYFVCQQGISAIQHMGDSAFLVFPQGNGRVHAPKSDMATIILAGTGRVHFLVVLAHQSLAAFRVSPDPVPKGFPDRLLFLGRQGGLLGVQHAALFSVCVLYGVIDTDIPQVQAVLQNLVGIGTAGSVGGVGCHIVVGYGRFPLDLPFSSKGRIVDLDTALEIKRGIKGLVHKLLDVLLVNPGSAQPHLDLRRIQVFGLGGGKSFHIDCINRVLLCRPLRLTQFSAYIAREVFISSHIMGRSVLLQLSRYTEDYALQLSGQFFFCFSGKLAHIVHIHAGFFRDGHRQCFTCRIHHSHRLMGLDGPFGEHICLAFQLSVLVDDFQRTEQVIGRIVCIGQTVCTVIDETVFGRKAVIEAVQFRLLLGNGAVRNRCIHLKVDQFLHTITQSHKTFHAGFGGGVEVGAHHTAVFPVVHLPVYNGIGIVLHIGVGRNGGVNSFAFAQLRQLCLLISAMNVLHGIMQLVGKLQSLDGVHGVVHTMCSAYRLLSAQHHFRVVDKIPVDGKPVLRLSGLGPFRHDVQRAVPLLEEDDVRYHLGTGILFERIIRQTDSSQQFGTLGKIAAHGGILGIHGIAGGHKSHHTAGTHLIQCFGEKVIMNVEIQLVVGFVIDLILTKRHIADGKVKKVTPVSGLKAAYYDVRLGIELLCDMPGNRVQLHTVQTAVSHFLRQHTEEVAHTHRWLQNISGLKAHAPHRFIDCLDNRRAGVMGIEGRASGGSVFRPSQQFF